MATKFGLCKIAARLGGGRRVLAIGVGLSVLAIAGAAGPVITKNGAPKSSRMAASAEAEKAAAGIRSFEFYLTATANDPLIRQYGGVDPVRTEDLGGTPYRNDVIDIAGWKLGRYRRQGPHLIALQTPNLSEHMRELELHVPKMVPEGFAGLVVIDYEPWWALWERTPNNPSTDAVDAYDSDYKDDWRDYIRENRTYLLDGLSADEQEAVFKRTYESFVRTFLLATYYKCKQLRPRAQWGYYNYPQVLIHSDLTPHGVQGYGDLTHRASQLNDETSWFYDVVDFVSPRIYPSRRVPENWVPAERQPGEISPRVHETWLASMVRESTRLAKGKPVYPYHSPIFYTTQPFDQEPVSRYQHEEVYRILAENGAAGVIIWHAVQDQERLDTWNQLWENELKPAGINSDRAINGGGSGDSGS
jgi:hypothetical protein